jgi:hypothetical protein
MGKIVFILGIAPRSGTNLLRKVLLLNPFIRNADVVGEDFLGRHSDHLMKFFDGMEKSWSEKWDWSQATSAKQRQRLQESVANSLLAYLGAHSHSSEERIVTATPYPFGWQNLLKLFPDGRIIFLLRDPRDVIESGVIGGFWSYEQGIELLAACAQTVAYAASNRRCHTVRYEHLLEDPLSVANGIQDFLSVPRVEVSEGMLHSLPVFGSSTTKVDGSFEWRVSERQNDFNPIARHKSWGNRIASKYAEKMGDLHTMLGYGGIEAAGLFFRYEAKVYWIARDLVVLKRRLRRVSRAVVREERADLRMK